MRSRSLSRNTLLLKSLALALVAGVAVHAAENYTQWGKARTYRINTTSGGEFWEGTVSNFPLLVRIPAGDSVLTQAKNGGADIRFTKADSVTPLQYEIESWDAGTGAAIWVLLDTIKGNTANQTFLMRWGNAAAVDSSKGSAVFSPSNGYVAVWHMNGTANETDVTGNGNTATAAGTPGSVAGNIGKARTLDRASTQHFVVADHASLNWTTPGLTLSAWVKATDWEGSTRVFQKGTGGDAAQWGLRETSLDRMAIDVNATNLNTAGSAVPPTETWSLVHAVVDGSSRKIYLDGFEVATADYPGNDLATTATPLYIGRQPEAANYFNGALDELRVQKVGRGPEWIALEYANQKGGQQLIQIVTGTTRIAGQERRDAVEFSARTVGAGVQFRFARVSGGAVAVSDMHGRVVWRGTVAPGATELAWDAANASNGRYVARLTAVDGQGRTVTAERHMVLAR